MASSWCLLLLGGCDSAGTTPRVSESDSAGVHIVESAEPAWTDDTAWHLSSLPVTEVGTLSGAEADELFGVEDVDVLSDGRLVITNRGTHELRMYSPEGEFVGSIGGEGQGPGELIYPSQTWVGPGDSLFVRAFQRLSVFEGTGVFARSVPLSGSPPRDRFQDGTFLFVVIPPGVDKFEPGHFRPVNALVRSGADGSMGDTLALVSGTELYRFTSSAGGMSSFGAPFGSVRLAAALGNSVVTAGGTGFEIWNLDETGRLARIVRRQVEATEVSSADIAVLEERMLRAAPARAQADRRRLFLEWTYPEFKPALDDLLVDAEGNIWARSYRVDPSGPGEWSVFDPAGRWLGQVEMPPGLDVAEIGSDYVAGVWVDELGVEYVRLYALEKPMR